MKQKYLAGPAYLVAFLLIAFPVVDTVLSLWPLRFGQVNWRYGSVGMFSRAIMTPALGLLIAYFVAMTFEHRKTLRLIALLTGLVVLLSLISMPMFLLDAVQLRSQIRADAKTAFDVATILAEIKMLVGVLVFGTFALYSWKSSRRDPALVRGEARAAGAGLVGR